MIKSQDNPAGRETTTDSCISFLKTPLRLDAHDGAPLLGLPFLNNPLSARWYFRAYYIIFIAVYQFSWSWMVWNAYLWLVLSCLIPLLGMEFGPLSNYGGTCTSWFVVRLLFLINNNVIGQFVHPMYNVLQTTLLCGDITREDRRHCLSGLAPWKKEDDEDGVTQYVRHDTWRSLLMRNALQSITIGMLFILCILKDKYWTREDHWSFAGKKGEAGNAGGGTVDPSYCIGGAIVCGVVVLMGVGLCVVSVCLCPAVEESEEEGEGEGVP